MHVCVCVCVGSVCVCHFFSSFRQAACPEMKNKHEPARARGVIK